VHFTTLQSGKRRHPISGDLDMVNPLANDTTMDITHPLPVYVDLTDVKRKTKLIKLLPALAALQDNVEYKIVNRDDKLFFLREKRGVNSLHARRKKLSPGTSYHIDIEALPVHEQANIAGHNIHIGKTLFRFFVYVL